MEWPGGKGATAKQKRSRRKNTFSVRMSESRMERKKTARMGGAKVGKKNGEERRETVKTTEQSWRKQWYNVTDRMRRNKTSRKLNTNYTKIPFI